MICPKIFIEELVSRGYSLYSGVPCSYLTPLINQVEMEKDLSYVTASSEGDALSIISGAWLGGRKGVVMCQNSGLGNMINPLTSMSIPFGIPALLLITWRGAPGEVDEPQHEVMGEITTGLLDLIGIKWDYLPQNNDGLASALNDADHYMQTFNRPFAFVLKKDSFIDNVKVIKVHKQKTLPERAEALKVIVAYASQDALIIATTGKTGRELYTLKDNDKHLYCVGSMGYANALAHGLALSTHHKVIIVDGDGAALMHLGNLSSIGSSDVPNLVHIILDNGTYDSTGAQPTVSSSVDFVKLGQSLGYKKNVSCCTLSEFERALKETNSIGPLLIHLKINGGSMKSLGRPSISPHLVARRMRDGIRQTELGD